MAHVDVDRIAASVVNRGLTGIAETDLLRDFCEECRQSGLKLSTAVAVMDTLHPVHEGRAFQWRSDGAEEAPLIEYGSTTEGEAAAIWQQSIFYHLFKTGAEELRRRIGRDDPVDFATLEEFRAEGETDFIGFIHRFAGKGVIGEMDCIYSHWTTRDPEGFREADLDALRRLVPMLALAMKCAALTRIAGTLVEVYLGRDAGRRVLDGHISRGVAEQIHAVLWFSDLRGYTSIADTIPPDAIIPLLNEYVEAVISSVHDAGGDVLKLIGDGVLAVFKTDDSADACRRALRAEADLRKKIETLNENRTAKRQPITNVYLGLHVGDVFFGNIGSDERLDFTVVGPAVNEASRIASMCRSVDRAIIMSAEFAAATPEPERGNLVSVGRYALRGVARAQELFTLDPGMLRDPESS